jgi:hypothetical protein
MMVLKHRLAPALLLVVVCATALAPPARAENLGPGGGVRIAISDRVFGPYRLLVTTAPEPAYIGQVTFMVRVNDVKTGQEVRDAQVHLQLVTGSGPVITADATHKDAGNPVDYVAHVQLTEPGAWEVTVRIDGRQGRAQAVFTQRVSAPRQGTTLIAIALPFVVVLGILGGAWWARAGRPTRK